MFQLELFQGCKLNNNPECPHCNYFLNIKYGCDVFGDQRYKCKNCSRHFKKKNINQLVIAKEYSLYFVLFVAINFHAQQSNFPF